MRCKLRILDEDTQTHTHTHTHTHMPVKVVLNETEGHGAEEPTLGVTFKYRCTERVALQVTGEK
jgi:hypothetical protein